MRETVLRVYGADWCPATRHALAHLEQKGVHFEYINVEDDPQASQWVKDRNHGKELKPTIDIDGLILSEPSDEELDKALGKLSESSESELPS